MRTILACALVLSLAGCATQKQRDRITGLEGQRIEALGDLTLAANRLKALQSAGLPPSEMLEAIEQANVARDRLAAVDAMLESAREQAGRHRGVSWDLGAKVLALVFTGLGLGGLARLEAA